MKKLNYFIIIVILIGGMIGANPSFSLADSWMSHDSMDLEPLKGTVWMFSYTVGSSNHVDTITFSNDVVTTSSGTTVLLCKNQDNRDGGTVYADMSGFGRGFVAKIYSYSLDDNYNFIISGDTASGVYFRNNSTGSYISQYELHGVRISGPPIAQSGTIPIPVSQNAYNYPSAVNPVMQSNPADCKPFAIGDLSTGNLSLQVGLPAFSSGVDVYLAIGFSDALFLVDGSNALQSTSGISVLPKWKTNVYGAIAESLYGNIPTSLLPAGVYNLYTLVVPTGETDFSHYYFWSTNFTTDASTCISAGFYWYDNSCHADPACNGSNLSVCDTEEKCVSSGFFWANGSCTVRTVCSPANLSACMNRSDCEESGGEWHNYQASSAIRCTASTATTSSRTIFDFLGQ